MDGARFSLYFIRNRAYKVFDKEQKQNQHSSKKLLDKVFPNVPYSEFKFVMVKGDKSPYNNELNYWAQRNSKLYDNHTAKALKRQNHSCVFCGLKFSSDERVHLHHKDGNYKNWKSNNLEATHESCHDYQHMSKSHGYEFRKLDAPKGARPDYMERYEGSYPPSTQPKVGQTSLR